MSRRLGLIIGANRYQDPAFRPLLYAENDARALAQWLVNARGGGWAPADVQHLQGTHVTRKLVESLIGQMCLQLAEPGDLLLLYFAGHVFLDERSGEGFLALTDTIYQQPATGLSVNALLQHAMLRSRAAHILVVLDCFQTGRLWPARRASSFDMQPLFGPTTLQALKQVNNRLFLCSCRGNEMAAEGGEQSLGLFVHRLVVGLSGPARDQAMGAVSLRPLHSFLLTALGQQQRPQLFGQDQPPLLLSGEMPSSLSDTGQRAAAAPMPGVPRPSQPSQKLHAQPAQSEPFTTANLQPVTATLQNRMPETGKQQAVNPLLQQQCQHMLAQARQLLQAQQFPQAFALVEQVLQAMPGDIPALLLKAQILGSGGRAQEALVVLEQILQQAPENALAWSMRAVLLSNLSRHQDALAAIERSLELDVSNAETHSIKNGIMAKLALEQSQSQGAIPNAAPGQPAPFTSPAEQPRGSARTFFTTLGLQVLGFVICLGGAALPVLTQKIPSLVGIILMSLGLLLLIETAIRSAYRYGISHVMPSLLISLLAAATLGGLYVTRYRSTMAFLQQPDHQYLLVPVLFLCLWLVAAALVPLLAGIGGLMGGGIARARKA
ncbi:MAG: caspase family protein [Ktedonobacteraceae bacterium]|nr:caspase family protein [Ktedonobacteraceae bacterium]